MRWSSSVLVFQVLVPQEHSQNREFLTLSSKAETDSVAESILTHLLDATSKLEQPLSIAPKSPTTWYLNILQKKRLKLCQPWSIVNITTMRMKVLWNKILSMKLMNFMKMLSKAFKRRLKKLAMISLLLRLWEISWHMSSKNRTNMFKIRFSGE